MYNGINTRSGDVDGRQAEILKLTLTWSTYIYLRRKITLLCLLRLYMLTDYNGLSGSKYYITKRKKTAIFNDE